MENIFDNADPAVFAPELMCTRVFNFLRDAIVEERLKPGEKLNVAMIASRLGVSRSPVREAVRILEAHNFVETIPQKGAYVKQITTEEVEELYVVLKVLLSAAARLAAAHLSGENRDELLSIWKELHQSRKSDKNIALIEVIRKFHNFIAEASGNRLLKKLYDSMAVYRERPFLLSENVEQKDLISALDENIAISDAMLAGDADKAEKLMAELMVHAGKRTLKALSARRQNKKPAKKPCSHTD
jgi:DNA-binding GntR family transcriptional regulator